MEKALVARGLPRPPSGALAAWLEDALTEPALAGLCVELRELLQLHYRYRFDPTGLAEPEKQLLAQKVNSLLKTLSRI